ncbi:MAG: type II toxin-antitoxin system RelE/ParE family toxin [Proteobacteria bacterium]|nr:type II toxin-antitoxin system RelE/ParE family toxin [Pseudomonadota bacterium]
MRKFPFFFYRSGSGNEPVREWLKGLGASDRKAIGDDIQTVEFGWPIGMPLCRQIKGRKGMWEVRASLSGGRIARVLVCFDDGRLVLLHGFNKKTGKTSISDLDLADRRMKEVMK